MHRSNRLIALPTIWAVASLACFFATAADAQSVCVSLDSEYGSRSEVNRTLAKFGSRVVAVGRVDSVTPSRGIEVLGHFAMPVANESMQVGDYAAVIDWSRRGSSERILEIRALARRYVPGASEVFLKSRVAAHDALRGRIRVGQIEVDYTTSASVGLVSPLRDDVGTFFYKIGVGCLRIYLQMIMFFYERHSSDT